MGQGQFRRRDEEDRQRRQLQRRIRLQQEEEEQKRQERERQRAQERQRKQARQRERAKERFEYYAKASREFDDFWRTQDLKRLREAAEDLEEAHRRLHEDEEFWAALQSLPDTLKEKEKRAEVEAVLKPFDSFLAREERLLVEKANLPRQEVVRLLDNVNDAVRDRDRALRMVRDRTDTDAIENLRDRCKDIQMALRSIQDEISTVLASNEPQPVEDGRRYRWVNDVRTSILFLGGAALASFNIFVLAPSSPPEPSMLGGAQGMIQQVFTEDIVERIGKKLRGLGDKWKRKD
jgi:hypothetical protein